MTDPRTEAPRTEVLSWDWREQPDLDALGRAIFNLSDGWLRLYKVDTGSDEYAIVLAAEPLTEAGVDEVWRRRWEGENG